MVDLQQGFVLTRHWRDTPAGTEVEFWLATDSGPRRIRLPHQPSVAFIPAEQREQAEALLRDEKNVELQAPGPAGFRTPPGARPVLPAARAVDAPGNRAAPGRRRGVRSRRAPAGTLHDGALHHRAGAFRRHAECRGPAARCADETRPRLPAEPEAGVPGHRDHRPGRVVFHRPGRLRRASGLHARPAQWRRQRRWISSSNTASREPCC